MWTGAARVRLALIMDSAAGMTADFRFGWPHLSIASSGEHSAQDGCRGGSTTRGRVDGGSSLTVRDWESSRNTRKQNGTAIQANSPPDSANHALQSPARGRSLLTRGSDLTSARVPRLGICSILGCGGEASERRLTLLLPVDFEKTSDIRVGLSEEAVLGGASPLL